MRSLEECRARYPNPIGDESSNYFGECTKCGKFSLGPHKLGSLTVCWTCLLGEQRQRAAEKEVALGRRIAELETALRDVLHAVAPICGPAILRARGVLEARSAYPRTRGE